MPSSFRWYLLKEVLRTVIKRVELSPLGSVRYQRGLCVCAWGSLKCEAHGREQEEAF